MLTSNPRRQIASQVPPTASIESRAAELDMVCHAAFRSKDFTSPPTYKRTMIWSRSSLGTSLGTAWAGGGIRNFKALGLTLTGRPR